MDADGKVLSKRAARKAAKAKAEAAALKAAAKALAAAKGKGKGKGKGKTRENSVNKLPCYFFNQEGGCNKHAKDCKFAHVKLSAAEAAKLQKPPGRSSRDPSPAGGKGKGKTKPKGGVKKSDNPSYCFKFASPAGCNDSNCPYMHLAEDMVEEFKRSQKALREGKKKS